MHGSHLQQFPFLIPAPTSAAAASAKVPSLHRPCFVDSEVTSADFFAIELRDCFLGSVVVRHLHKAETFRPSGIAIRDDLNRFNLADLAEHVPEVSFCDLKREISNEDFFCHPGSIPLDLASFYALSAVKARISAPKPKANTE